MLDKYGVDDDFLKTITLLYVEDDEDMTNSVQRRFGGKFAKFTAVSDAETALEVFTKEHYDLIMTDYFLPKMNGLALTKEIKAIKSNTPVIMVTGHIDIEFLVSAINIGVTQFVTKPVQFKILSNAIMNAVERVVIENLRRKTREQELEILTYKENYHTMQQELALRKERNLIRNDLYMRYLSPDPSVFNPNGWNVAISYKSHDVVSGDIYACRKLNANSIILMVVDAMGKGVSAAFTTTLSIAVLNYFIDMHLSGSEATSLDEMLDKYLQFIKVNLLDDEILCLTMAHIDFKKEKMKYAAFSMPRMCLEMLDGSIKTVPSNNLPIMKFLNDMNVGEIDLQGVTKILISSDGLIESSTMDGGIYSSYLEEDFKESPCMKNFESLIKTRVSQFDDDMSMFFVRRPFADMIFQDEIAVESSYAGLEELETFFKDNLNRFGMGGEESESFFGAFSEATMNAYEHGNLAIKGDQKNALIEKGIYEEILAESEINCTKKIKMRFICCKNSQYRYIVVGIRDEGEGYPMNIFKSGIGMPLTFSGRGLKIISHYTDELFFSEDRREIFIVKFYC